MAKPPVMPWVVVPWDGTDVGHELVNHWRIKAGAAGEGCFHPPATAVNWPEAVLVCLRAAAAAGRVVQGAQS